MELKNQVCTFQQAEILSTYIGKRALNKLRSYFLWDCRKRSPKLIHIESKSNNISEHPAFNLFRAYNAYSCAELVCIREQIEKIHIEEALNVFSSGLIDKMQQWYKENPNAPMAHREAQLLIFIFEAKLINPQDLKL